MGSARQWKVQPLSLPLTGEIGFYRDLGIDLTNLVLTATTSRLKHAAGQEVVCFISLFY